MPGQIVQTQIEEQSVLGLHCLPFRLHRLDTLLYDRANLRVITTNVLDVRIFRKFTVTAYKSTVIKTGSSKVIPPWFVNC